MDVDTQLEAHEVKKKHEETQGMLRGVTESLVKATEKLQQERKTRKSLEFQLSKSSGFVLQMEPDEDMLAEESAKKLQASSGMINFANIRAEMDGMNTEMADDKAAPAPLETPKANGDVEPAAASSDHEMEDDEPTLGSLKEFLAKTPKTKIDWTTAGTPPAGTTTTTPRSRDRGGVRLCRLLIHVTDMNATDAQDVKDSAGKYNLGGYIKTGKTGLIVVEGLEFNCDIFMDNMEGQKKKYTNAGKVSERSGRAFPMELTQLEGDGAFADFSKACESIGLKDKLDAVMKK
jgi:hypothetical protein